MTADDMATLDYKSFQAEMADHHEHMFDWCWEAYKNDDGVVADAWLKMREMHRESAHYWREKARENE